ncbi:hypothetical protein I4U23_022291 [Adineta vaga]|nr:hypothetical protein I4U23_022291 [Adineta vaga]
MNFKCRACENAAIIRIRASSCDRVFHQPDYDIKVKSNRNCSVCRYRSNASRQMQSDEHFLADNIYNETNSKRAHRQEYIEKSYANATEPFLAEGSRYDRIMSRGEFTRRTFQSKDIVLEQPMTIDRRYNRLKNDHQQLQQQVNNLSRLFDIFHDRNERVQIQVNDLITENHRLETQNINELEQQLGKHDLQFNQIWARINTIPSETDQQIINNQAETIDRPHEEENILSEERIPVEEDAYYEKCKRYFNITQMPLISISDNLLNDDFELTSILLVCVVDQDLNELDEKIFLNKICKILDTDDIVIRKIQIGCVKIVFEIFKNISGKLKKISIKSLYQSLTDTVKRAFGELKVIFMFMGDIETFDEKQKIRNEIQLHSDSNRIYKENRTYWIGTLNDGRDRGPYPYYCPIGWKRYSFYVTDNFVQKFNGWSICYHGTRFTYGLSILLSGLAPAKHAEHGPGIYATPSIIYASHPRYSEVKHIESTEEKEFFKEGNYIQFVLQCRVHPDHIIKIGKETLKASSANIDSNIKNDVIEWIIKTADNSIVDFNDPNATIICTGLMVRVTDNHPGLLPESEWWFKSHLCPNKGNLDCCFLGIDLDDLKNQKQSGVQSNIIYQ